ncbi:hypothetical protein [Odoribacter lunatus]|uniref:hypothetical protein n=1 Tax=Odoribacter lunatus TaxID=2941335 RepID=UPI00203E51B4|nr:hypothetical protein [Odoribacter lunatus]
MKRILSIFLMGLLPLMGANAQENIEEKDIAETSKQYLPEKGDWTLGIDVLPLLKYIGTAFHSSKADELNGLGGTPFTKGSSFADKNKTLMPDVSVMGKYLLTDKWALRANIGFKVGLETDKSYVKDDRASVLNLLGSEKVENKITNNKSGVSIMLGAEYRKGERRVQGVFGAGLLFAFMNNKVKYDYGNEMTSVNQNPTGSLWGDDDLIPSGYRILMKYNTGASFYTGITGSAGVEWFVAPKISLGAEVNLSVYYLFSNQTYVESEGYNATLGRVETRTDLVSPGNRGFYADTESLGGALSLNFYF